MVLSHAFSGRHERSKRQSCLPFLRKVPCHAPMDRIQVTRTCGKTPVNPSTLPGHPKTKTGVAGLDLPAVTSTTTGATTTFANWSLTPSFGPRRARSRKEDSVINPNRWRTFEPTRITSLDRISISAKLKKSWTRTRNKNLKRDP